MNKSERATVSLEIIAKQLTRQNQGSLAKAVFGGLVFLGILGSVLLKDKPATPPPSTQTETTPVVIVVSSPDELPAVLEMFDSSNLTYTVAHSTDKDK